MSVRVRGLACAMGMGIASIAPVAGASDWAAHPAADWPTNGGDWSNSRFSAEAEITPANVKSLGGAWRTELPGASSKASPIIQDGVMYVAYGGGDIVGGAGGGVYALDAGTGAILWNFTPGKAGISALNKGVGVGGGLVYVGLSNAHVAAIDAKTGKLAWEGIAGDDPAAPGQFISAAPVYVDGKVLVGVGSGDAGIRGRLVALDAGTGKVAWRFETIPGPGQPGHETWPKDGDAWEHGGAGIWASPAVDRELGLVIFGTGNGYPQYAGQVRPGNNLYTASVIAVDLKTGKYRWHYQTAHHEIWEADLGAPMVLYDTAVNGRPVKAVAALRTDGYVFLLDRRTGKPIIPVEERAVKQNARMHTSPTQPFPVGADKVGPNCVEKDMIPAGFVPGCFWDPVDYDQPNIMLPSATRFAPMAYDAKDKLFVVAGGAGATWARRQPDPKFFNFSSGFVPGVKNYGLLTAFDAATDKIVWQKRLPHQVSFGGGATATAGGLVFHAEPDGNLQAYDARSGDMLFQYQTGAPANGAVVVYTLNGHEHVAGVSGQYVWSLALGGTVPPAAPLPPIPTETAFSGRIVPTDHIAMSAELENNGVHQEVKYTDEYALKPARAKVKVGTKVTWTNTGKEPHDATAQDGSWSTGEIPPGGSASVTFDKPGTYTYICKDHPWSLGQLIVE